MPLRPRRRFGWSGWGRALVAGAIGIMLGVTLLPTTAGAESTPGVTSTSITIGATVPLTGPAAPGYDEIAPAMDAVFDYVNAHGGVDGRKINYTYLDDGYNPANTATLTRKLVLQDNIFADVGSLGTPTQSAVQAFLNEQKVPQLFIESGCNCWSNPKYPYSLGWQPPYTVDGKILGSYIKANFAGKKIGYLYQDDEFGQDVVKGLDMEIPSSSVVSAPDLRRRHVGRSAVQPDGGAEGCGAQVVVLATIPAATALAMLPAAAPATCRSTWWTASGLTPHRRPVALVVRPEGWRRAGAGVGRGRPVQRGHHHRVLRARESDTTNPWVQFERKILERTRRSFMPSRTGREQAVRRGAGLHVRSGAADSREEPDAGRPMNAINSDGKTSSLPASCRSPTPARCTSGSRVNRS